MTWLKFLRSQVKPILNKINRLLRNSLLTGFWSRFTQPDRYSSFYFSTQTIARPLGRPDRTNDKSYISPYGPILSPRTTEYLRHRKEELEKGEQRKERGEVWQWETQIKTVPSIAVVYKLKDFSGSLPKSARAEIWHWTNQQQRYRPKKVLISLWENVGNRSVTCWTLNRSNIEKVQDHQQRQNNRRRSNWEKGEKRF